MNGITNFVHSSLGPLNEIASTKGRPFDTFFSLVSINLLLAGLSFVTTMVIANVLGKRQFGDLSYAIAIGGYCVTIANCGLERTLIRDLVHYPDRFDEYTSASILLSGSMLVAGFVAIVVINGLAAGDNRLKIAGILIVFIEGIKALYLAPIYDAWNKMKRHAVYLLLERCFYFACVWSVVVLMKDKLSILAIAFFMLVSTAMGFALQYRWALARLNIRIDRRILCLAVGMLKKNLWIWSAVLATLSFGGLSKIVLRNISGSGELGGYAVAWQVVLLGSILISQIGRVGNPRMARIVQPQVTREHRIRFLMRYMALSTLVGGVIGVPAICFPAVLLRLFSREYAPAATSVRIFGVYVIVIAIGQVATQYLIAIREERLYSVVVILTGGLSLLLYSICIPRWAALGAALAVLLSHGTAIAIYLVIMTRHALTRRERIQAIA